MRFFADRAYNVSLTFAVNKIYDKKSIKTLYEKTYFQIGKH